MCASRPLFLKVGIQKLCEPYILCLEDGLITFAISELYISEIVLCFRQCVAQWALSEIVLCCRQCVAQWVLYLCCALGNVLHSELCTDCQEFVSMKVLQSSRWAPIPYLATEVIYIIVMYSYHTVMYESSSRFHRGTTVVFQDFQPRCIWDLPV